MKSNILRSLSWRYRKVNIYLAISMSHLPFSWYFSVCLTPVCQPSGENSSCCFCENGYAWPSSVCSDVMPCSSVSLEPAQPCGYMQKMPFYGPYCEPQTEGKRHRAELHHCAAEILLRGQNSDKRYKKAHQDWAGHHPACECGKWSKALLVTWAHLDPNTCRCLVAFGAPAPGVIPMPLWDFQPLLSKESFITSDFQQIFTL